MMWTNWTTENFEKWLITNNYEPNGEGYYVNKLTNKGFLYSDMWYKYTLDTYNN